MDTRLMDLLVCPLCKGPLSHDHATHELVCGADRLAFPIRDGIAVMLETEARNLDVPASATTAATGHDPSAA
ncbi:Trm112 family protein [Leptothrix discophora]|uniref:UPF0434 protein Q8X39_01175 n=1 Tax=Leptothrix discophora TaxID=89 RepID=A0ABT9FYC8_LEPDI|nr:Trm112 family protein [Leptothrix discophora]MDP4299236.1 Trm112 family protein [Leptothrix discophora]